MSGNPVLFYVFILANIAIVLGYAFMASFVAPRYRLRSTATKMGGVAFFALCGMTHAGLAYYALNSPALEASIHGGNHGGASFMDLAMFWVHVFQAPAVWVFVVGLYVELGKFGDLDVRGQGAHRGREEMERSPE